MDIETLQLMLEMGPEAAGAVKAYIIANALSGMGITVAVFGTMWWTIRCIARANMFEALDDEGQQEYLRRKFKVGKPNEETSSSDV